MQEHQQNNDSTELQNTLDIMYKIYSFMNFSILNI